MGKYNASSVLCEGPCRRVDEEEEYPFFQGVAIFAGEDGKALHSEEVTKIMKGIFHLLGLSDEGVTSHALRRTGVQWLRLHGALMKRIQAAGHWR